MLGSPVHAHRGVGECSRHVAQPNFTVSGALLPAVRLQKAPAVPREGLCCRPCPLVLQGMRREKHVSSSAPTPFSNSLKSKLWWGFPGCPEGISLSFSAQLSGKKLPWPWGKLQPAVLVCPCPSWAWEKQGGKGASGPLGCHLGRVSSPPALRGMARWPCPWFWCQQVFRQCHGERTSQVGSPGMRRDGLSGVGVLGNVLSMVLGLVLAVVPAWSPHAGAASPRQQAAGEGLAEPRHAGRAGNLLGKQQKANCKKHQGRRRAERSGSPLLAALTLNSTNE